jgi:exosortase A-associated hydrolase 2
VATGLDAFHLPAASGRRLCVFEPARLGPVRAAVVHVPALFEEMNKSRRMVALQSRALAEAGCAVLRIDLAGTGDSSGELGDTRWEDWCDDVALAAGWLTARIDAPLWLWGLRGGTLLAAQAAGRVAREAGCHLLFWQPAMQGKSLLQQFLRLRTARGVLAGEGAGEAEAVRRELALGRAVEVAGYALGAKLARGLETATLAAPDVRGRSVWLELSARGEPSPASRLAAERWAAAGRPVQLHAASGPSFWQTTEIETAPELIALTLRALLDDAVVPA